MLQNPKKQNIKRILFFLFITANFTFSQEQDTSLYFNGNYSYADCGNNSSLTPQNAITICASFKTEEIARFQTILWRGDVWMNYYGIKLTDDGRIRATLFLDEFTHLFSQKFFNDSTWYHIAFTYDNSDTSMNFKLYVDGQLDTAISAKGNIKWDSNSLLIGKYPYIDDQVFMGNIKNVQIWNRALSPNEIQQNMNGVSDPENAQGLAGYWPMNEDEGSIIHDLSGNGNDGYIYGAQWVPNNNVTAVISAETVWLDKDYDGFASEEVNASLSSGEISSYTWSVGNDTVATGINPVIVLPTGSQYLKLTVRNNNDKASTDSIMISVYAASFNTNGPVRSAVSQLDANTFFISSEDDKVYCFDSTGTIKWNYQTGGYIQSTVSVSDENNIFVTSSDTRLYSFNHLGIPNWDKAMGGVIVSSPTVQKNNMILAGLITGRLFAVDYNGSVKWSVQAEDAITASPVIGSDGTIYFGSNDKKLFAVSDSGKVLWTYPTLDSIISSAALGNDSSVIFGSSDGYVYKVDLDGNLLWKFNTAGAIYAAPVIGENAQIFIGSSSGFFYSISKDGDLLWEYNANSSVKSTAAISNDASTVYVGSGDGRVLALSANGELKWYLQTAGSILSPLLITENNLLLVSTANGSVYIMKVNSGPGSFGYLEWPTFLGNNQRTGEQGTLVTGIGPEKSVPTKFLLNQNYPNPFNPTTTINFALPVESNVVVLISNILGEKIEELDLGIHKAGTEKIIWDASKYASGIYFYSIHAVPTNGANEFHAVKKMILIK